MSTQLVPDPALKIKIKRLSLLHISHPLFQLLGSFGGMSDLGKCDIWSGANYSVYFESN
jgi:hypothetical protein